MKEDETGKPEKRGWSCLLEGVLAVALVALGAQGAVWQSKNSSTATPAPDDLGIPIFSLDSGEPGHMFFDAGEKSEDVARRVVTPRFRDCQQHSAVVEPPIQEEYFDVPLGQSGEGLCDLVATMLSLPNLSETAITNLHDVANYALILRPYKMTPICGERADGCYLHETEVAVVPPLYAASQVEIVVHEFCHGAFDLSSPVEITSTSPNVRFIETALFANNTHVPYANEVLADICAGAFRKWFSGPSSYSKVITSGYVGIMFKSTDLVANDPTAQVIDLNRQMNDVEEWLVQNNSLATLLNAVSDRDMVIALSILDQAATGGQSATPQGGIDTLLSFSRVYQLFEPVFSDSPAATATPESSP